MYLLQIHQQHGHWANDEKYSHTLRERRDTRSKFLLIWRCCQFLFRFFLYLCVIRGILFSFFFFYCQSLCLLLLSFSHLIFLFLRLLRVYLVLDIYCKWYLSRFFLSFLHDMIILNLLSMNEDDFTNRKIKFFKILLLFNSHCYCEYSIETGLLEIYSNIFDCAWNSFNLNLGFRINPNVSE